MKLALIVSYISCIIVSPLIMHLWGRRILKRNIPDKEKMYNLVKAQIICLSGVIMHFVAVILLDALNWALSVIDPLPLPVVVKAFSFAIILTFPMLISIFLVIHEAAKAGVEITKEKLETKDVLEAIAIPY